MEAAPLLAPLLLIGGGLPLLLSGLWALRSGRVITKWTYLVYKPSAIYWITVITLIAVGSLNVVFGIAWLLS